MIDLNDYPKLKAPIVSRMSAMELPELKYAAKLAKRFGRVETFEVEQWQSNRMRVHGVPEWLKEHVPENVSRLDVFVFSPYSKETLAKIANDVEKDEHYEMEWRLKSNINDRSAAACEPYLGTTDVPTTTIPHIEDYPTVENPSVTSVIPESEIPYLYLAIGAGKNLGTRIFPLHEIEETGISTNTREMNEQEARALFPDGIKSGTAIVSGVYSKETILQIVRDTKASECGKMLGELLALRRNPKKRPIKKHVTQGFKLSDVEKERCAP